MRAAAILFCVVEYLHPATLNGTASQTFDQWGPNAQASQFWRQNTKICLPVYTAATCNTHSHFGQFTAFDFFKNHFFKVAYGRRRFYLHATYTPH
jgi:hypothetical protein